MDAAGRFDARDLTEAQKTVRILSGLYGVLRPLDLMQPYRLEMGTRLATDRGDSLYAWWGDRITEQLATDLADSPGPAVIVNLASQEYSGSVSFDDLDARIVTPRFEDRAKSGAWKVISFSAKRARGEMAAWIVQAAGALGAGAAGLRRRGVPVPAGALDPRRAGLSPRLIGLSAAV